jgi:antitoxin MazE
MNILTNETKISSIQTGKDEIKTRPTIQELFADYEGDYQPEDFDWGEPVGDEI